jgi:hypothetical protein
MRSTRALLLALTLALAAGCGDAGRNPVAPEPPAALTDEVRFAAITALETRLQQLAPSLSDDAWAAAVVQWLNGRAEFETAEAEPDAAGVSARFTDGRVLIASRSRVPGPPSAEVTDPEVAADAETSSISRNVSAQLPRPLRVRLLHSFGADFDQVQQPVDDMARWFRAAGYDVAPGVQGDARLTALRNVSGDAFFYLNTHGGVGKTREGEKLFAVQSSTLSGAEMDRLPEIRGDLDAGRLVYMTFPNGRWLGEIPRVDTRYGITHRFVREHMSFGEGSVVFLNVCWSASDAPGVAAFIAAAHARGAAHVLGWTRNVSTDPAFRAVRHFVDRTLGANRYRPESPLQRPFDVPAVLDEMRGRGYATDAATRAELRLHSAPGREPAILVPSIYGLQGGADAADLLVIHGQFGPDPGESLRSVTIDGVNMAVGSWASGRIELAIPRSGPGASGVVRVTSLGRESNGRALVAWRGSMRSTTRGGGTLEQRLEWDLHLRGDPDRARRRPGAEPEDLPDDFVVWGIRGAAGTFAASGSRSYAIPGDPCGRRERWQGSGALAYGHAPAGDRVLFYAGNVREAQRTLRLGVVAFGPQTLTIAMEGRECSGVTTTPTFAEVPRALFGDDATVPIPLGAGFNLPAGRVEASFVGPYTLTRTSTATLEWDAIPAVPAVLAPQKK